MPSSRLPPFPLYILHSRHSALLAISQTSHAWPPLFLLSGHSSPWYAHGFPSLSSIPAAQEPWPAHLEQQSQSLHLALLTLLNVFFFFSFTRRAILGKNHWNCWKIIYRQSSLYTGSVQGFNQPRIWIPWIPRANCTTTFCKRYPWILVSAGILESIPWEYRGPIIMPKKKNQALLLIIWMCTKMPRKHLISLVRLVTYFSM